MKTSEAPFLFAQRSVAWRRAKHLFLRSAAKHGDERSTILFAQRSVAWRRAKHLFWWFLGANSESADCLYVLRFPADWGDLAE